MATRTFLLAALLYLTVVDLEGLPRAPAAPNGKSCWPWRRSWTVGVRGSDAAPIKPDFTTCGVHAHSPGISCCTLPELMHRPGPAVYKEWSQYVRENPLPKQPLVRMAAHLQEVAGNQTYLQQLNLAYQRMQALPHDDPRSLYQQNMYHCMYGGINVTRQLGHPDQEYNIHFSWLFWPYHRMFTFFFERILAKLVDDDKFVLPFWNWDNQAPLQPLLPNALPHFMRNPDEYPALYDPNRHPRHRPGQPAAMADLTFNSADPTYEPEEPAKLREANDAQLRKYVLELTSGPGGAVERFLGYPIRAGDKVDMFRETFETEVHGKIHMWLGDDARNGEDMGQGYAAVLDPIFFIHHANVDRIWTVWEALGRQQYRDPDFLEVEMFFYNENGELVRVTVAECLDWSPLLPSYQDVDNPWLDPTIAPHVQALQASSSS